MFVFVENKSAKFVDTTKMFSHNSRRITLSAMVIFSACLIIHAEHDPNKDVELITETQSIIADSPTRMKHDLVERSYVLNDFYANQVRKTM